MLNRSRRKLSVDSYLIGRPHSHRCESKPQQPLPCCIFAVARAIRLQINQERQGPMSSCLCKESEGASLAPIQVETVED